MILRPEILTHENIPKPLHGRNPRTILGKKWWDIEREKAYAANDYHCLACGEKPGRDEKHRLEAHEFYEIDHETAIVKYIEPVALCKNCHSFIHSGRMYSLYKKGQMSRDRILTILNRGFKLLKENKLSAYWNTKFLWLILNGYSEAKAEVYLLDRDLIPISKYANKWSEWTLEMNGKKYYSLYENEQEWENFYNK